MCRRRIMDSAAQPCGELSVRVEVRWGPSATISEEVLYPGAGGKGEV